MTEHDRTDVARDQVDDDPAAPTSDGAAADVPDEGPTDGAADAGGADGTPDDGGPGVDEQTEARSTEELLAAVAEAERTAEEYLDHLRRERAEFENFRKRMQRERMEALDRGAEQLAASLLPVLDNFGYTLQAAAASEDTSLAKGIGMVHAELVETLNQAGLTEVPGVGAEFDPNVHEAMLSEDADEPLEEPVVAEVLRAGYAFKGRVLRPASVKVAR